MWARKPDSISVDRSKLGTVIAVMERARIHASNMCIEHSLTAKPNSTGRAEWEVMKCEYDFTVVGRGSGVDEHDAENLGASLAKMKETCLG